MKVIVFGATGGVGTEVVKQTLAAGHQVTAFVRSPEKLQHITGSSAVSIVVGNANDQAAVSAAMVGQEAVFSCLGSSAGMKASTELRDMTANIVIAMQAAGVQRIIYCASAGVEGELQGVMGKAVAWMLRHPLADHRAAIAHITSAKLDYTLVRPSGLSNDEIRTDYREVWEGFDGVPKSIPRASVPHFMIHALAEPETYVGKSVAVTL